MITTADFKRGCRLTWKDEPHVIIESSSQSPSARGGATLVKVKMKNILTGQLFSVGFKAGEKFHVPDLEYRTGQYLYDEGDIRHFMDNTTYEQVPLTLEILGDDYLYLTENMEVRILYWDDKPIGMDVPQTVVHKIAQCDPGTRGDTVTNITKEATTETGLKVQVPLFVEEVNSIRIDSRDGRYLERAK